MENKILLFIYIIITVNLSSQNSSCNDYKIFEETKLYTYNCDPNKSLVYKFLMCKHFGKHKSLIEITKSDEYDTTEIKGVLKIDIGNFEKIEKKSSEVTSLNYQNDKVTYTTENNEQRENQVKWEKWYGIMKFNCYVESVPKITFEGACILNVTKSSDWSNWISLWENKQDSISVMYRTKSYIDEKSNKHKTDIEIQGPKNYTSGEVFIRGYIKNGTENELDKNVFLLTESGKSIIIKLDGDNFNSDDIIITTKKYKSQKTIKLKTKTVIDGRRG